MPKTTMERMNLSNTAIWGGLLPMVSIILPVHNEEKVLLQTLESLRKQDYPDDRFEIIVGLNGCTDASRSIANEFGVHVAESKRKGISFGRNLGARAARGDILVFIDADTTIPPDGLARIAMAVDTEQEAILVLPGRPVAGGPVVKICFAIANLYARRKGVLSPGPVMATHRTVYERVNGFDEMLPQGEASDFVIRCRQSGAKFLFPRDLYATTSIRRFERFGIIPQMLSWRVNHRYLEKGQRERVHERTYPVVR